MISIIIPTLNEAENIAGTVNAVSEVPGVEVIVADGGSTDDTVALAGSAGATIVTAPRIRAAQMNAGASAASGAALLFLHADTRLPRGFEKHVRRTLARPGVAAGAFEVRFDVHPRGLGIIERLVNWRSRRLGLPYGDQGIFIRAEVFRALGGFADLPIMEDFEFMRCVRRYGRVKIVPARVVTSGRRWQALGVVRTTLINQGMTIGYYAGIPVDRLAAWYRKPRSGT